ncbi:GldG family protein [Litoribacillus peritrichatus]|uniref:GldG family protein n=1 Tax=Litoribacillus peritrichatus TaxID=718191 RepID=A0ABP7NAE9_9GAMM
MGSKFYSRTGLFALCGAFLVLVMLIQWLFSSARVDLTDNNLYTISEGTKNIVSDLEEPVVLKFYFSWKETEGLPAIRDYAKRVQELLEEYVVYSDGKLSLEIIDPVAFSEQEDEATEYGLQGVPLDAGGANLYFGLVAEIASEDAEDKSALENISTSNSQVIPFIQLDQESYLEYDLSKLIYTAAHPKLPVVGILSTLDVNGGMDFMTRQQKEPWMVIEQIKQLFDVRELEDSVTEIPSDVDVLMLIHPKDLNDDTLLAIDQYVLSGGKAMVFVDPKAEQEQQMSPLDGNEGSDLRLLLEAWGVEPSSGQFVADAQYAMAVNLSQSQRPVRHLALLNLLNDEDNAVISSDDITTADLESITFSSAMSFTKLEDGTSRFTPLLSSSEQSGLMDANLLANLADPTSLYSEFEAKSLPLVLAARVTGNAVTAFPDGVDVVIAAEEQDAAEEESTEAESAEPKTQTIMPAITSSDKINVILVGDTDILSDRLWVQVQNFFGQRIPTPWADNAGFVINSLDNLAGSADLIDIRSRGRYTRSFKVVDDLKREAEEKFRAEEEVLEQQLVETEQQLNELQPGPGGEEISLTAEQEQALASFIQKKLDIRKRLREVRLNLDQDIEALGTKLKLINILLIPSVLTIIVIFVAMSRRKKRAR